MQDNIKMLGIAMVLLGAVLLLGSTAAFDSTHADRAASVSIPADHEAYLALTGNADVVDCNWGGSAQECVDDGDWTQALTTENLFNEDMNSVEVSVSNPGPIELVDAETLTAVGYTYEYDLPLNEEHQTGFVCSEEAEGTTDVVLEVTAEAGGSSIETSRTYADVQYDCTPGESDLDGFRNVTAGDVYEDGTSPTGYSQTFEFDVENLGGGEEVRITFSNLDGVDYSEAEVDGMPEDPSGQGEAEFRGQPDDPYIWYEAQGNTDGVVTIDVQGVEVTDTDGGGLATFTRLDDDVSDEDSFGVE